MGRLTAGDLTRVCRDDVLCRLVQQWQEWLVELSTCQSLDGSLCLGASTVPAVLHGLEGAIFTFPGRELLAQPRGCGCSSPSSDRWEEGAGLAELGVKLCFVGFRLSDCRGDWKQGIFFSS